VRFFKYLTTYRGADKEINKLQRQKILILIYPIYNNNWRNIITIYIYITRLESNEIFSPLNKIHGEVVRAKDLSAPLYNWQNILKNKLIGIAVRILI
jgi:hypothetical protein